MFIQLPKFYIIFWFWSLHKSPKKSLRDSFIPVAITQSWMTTLDEAAISMPSVLGLDSGAFIRRFEMVTSLQPFMWMCAIALSTWVKPRSLRLLQFLNFNPYSHNKKILIQNKQKENLERKKESSNDELLTVGLEPLCCHQLEPWPFILPLPSTTSPSMSEKRIHWFLSPFHSPLLDATRVPKIFN